jgi:DNA polymerase III epsilon subunit-like protein
MNRSISAPRRMKNVLVFDVETTGLLPKTPKTIAEYPYILQLSFAIYDLDKNEITTKYDSYVAIDDSVIIEEKITEITKITADICKTKGKKIVEILKDFRIAYEMCEGMVAHNMKFDQEMITVEIQRNRKELINYDPECLNLFNPIYEQLNITEKYCTMQKGIKLCNIEMPPNPKFSNKIPDKPRLKYPKLSELYLKLFENETIPENLHNAMVDVMTCLRCYLKMRHSIDMLNYTGSDSSSNNINAIAA